MARRPRPGSIRNVVTGRSDGYTGRVPFPRLAGHTVAYESLLARDFLMVTAAFETDIVSITSEPARLVLRIDGDPVRWDPDYEITRRTRQPEYVEVKPIEEVEPRRARFPRAAGDELERLCAAADARFQAMEIASEAAGRAFRLTTEDEIRIEPLLTNAATVLRHGDGFYPPSALLAGREALARHRPAGVERLQELLPDLDAKALSVRLFLAGELDFDRGRVFGRDGVFTRFGRAFGDDLVAGGIR